DNDVDLVLDELGRDLGVALAAAFRPAVLDCDGTALDPAEFAQPLHEGGNPLAPPCRCGRAQESYSWKLAWLLRARLERPCSRRAAEERDEMAPPHHSITSSARARSVGGNASPSTLAVFKLMMNSNLVDCTTGKSAGFSPLRMRPA